LHANYGTEQVHYHDNLRKSSKVSGSRINTVTYPHLPDMTQPLPGIATSPVLDAPSLLRRMACWLYEGMLLFGVVFIAGYLFSALSQTKNAMDNRHALQAFIFVVFGIYFGWLWSKGQTLAMKTWHIRVVDLQGKPLTQGLALTRYLWSWLWVLPPLLAAWLFNLSGVEATVITLGWVAVWAILSRFHPRQQFWHDALAGTQLITALPRKK